MQETLEAVALYRQNLGAAFWALELNLSCPNVAEDMACSLADGLACVRALKAAHPGLFLIAKISIRHPYEFAQELEKAGAGALHAINTIPYEMVFPPGRFPPSPLADAGGGGVSGGPAFAQAYQYNQGLRPLVRLPIIMGCGVTCAVDVQRYLDLGADAVSICTLALRQPGEVRKMIGPGTSWMARSSALIQAVARSMASEAIRQRDSSSSVVMHRGGMRISTSPRGRRMAPSLRASRITRCPMRLVTGKGSRFFLSATSSMPTMKPRWRTSPTWGCEAIS